MGLEKSNGETQKGNERNEEKRMKKRVGEKFNGKDEASYYSFFRKRYS